MKTVGKVTVAVLAVLFCLVVAGSEASGAPAYPEPLDNINDYVGVLSAEDRAKLEDLADTLWERARVALAVAIVNTTGEESIKMYAVKLYEKWGIGARGEDKGLLLVVAVDDRKVTMEVGYGLEPVITDSRAGRCLDEMTPYFKENRYGEGIYRGLMKAVGYIQEDMGVDLEGKGLPPEVEDEKRSGWFPFILLPVVMLLGGGLVLASFLFSVLRPRCPRCGNRLTVMDKVIQQATYTSGGLASTLYRCAQCGYTREKLYRTPPLVRTGWGYPGTGKTVGHGPWFGGFGGSSKRGGSTGPTGFGGGRSGGGGATRGW